MRKLITSCFAVLLSITISTVANSQSTSPAKADEKPVFGEIAALDSINAQITIKTTSGAARIIKTDERIGLWRVPPAERSLDKAVKIHFSELNIGEPVLVRQNQIIVMSKEALTREQARQHTILGVVMELKPQTKEITLRGREGSAPILITSNSNTRWLRYASDSLKVADAVPGSFADLRVGDQLRARGERNTDGWRFAAEEIISGTFVRVAGEITAIDAATGTITIKTQQTAEKIKLVVAPKTVLKRIPFFESTNSEVKENAGAKSNRMKTLQQQIAALPAIPLTNLKRGDTALVFGTASLERNRIIAISIVTGKEEVIGQLHQLQGAINPEMPDMNEPFSGDVVGTGMSGLEQPKSHTDPP